MGLFGGNPDKGLYTGDAPVSMPGTGGQAPQRYVGQQYIDYARDPAQRTAAPGLVPAHPKKGRAGAVVGAAIVVGVLALGGALLFTASVDKSATVSRGGSAGGATGLSDVPDEAGRGAMGEPATVEIFGARYAITPKVAFAEPGRGFAYSTPDDQPQLLISTDIERLDTGSDPTGPTGLNWTFDTQDGDTVNAELAPTYHPNLALISLAGGESTGGYLVFGTDATAGVLRFTSGFSGETLAAWEITSETMKTVIGTFGDPVWADISIPRFTVAVDEPYRLVAGDPELRVPPQSGQYLMFDVHVVPNKGSSGYLGSLGSRSFAFVPAGSATDDDAFAGAIDVTLLATARSLDMATLNADSELHSTIAFDTDATAGTLYFFNGADWALIDWPVG